MSADRDERIRSDSSEAREQVNGLGITGRAKSRSTKCAVE
jgi:hypothetical protein